MMKPVVATQTRSATRPTRGRFSGLLPHRLLRFRRPVWWQEIAIIALGYWLYSLGRNAIPEQISIAIRHGLSIQHLQDIVGLNFELSINHGSRARVGRADPRLLLRDAALRRHHRRAGVAVHQAPAHLPRRAHRPVHADADRAGRLRAVPGRAAAAAARLRLHRHRRQVPHLGLAGRSRDRLALQPVRRDAEPAHRLGAVGRHLDLHVRAADVGARARPALPVLHPDRDHRHGQPLHHRRRRRRAIVVLAFGIQALLSGHGAFTPPYDAPDFGLPTRRCRTCARRAWPAKPRQSESARRTRPRRPCARAARRAGSRRPPRPGRTRRGSPARGRRRPAACPASGSGPRPCRAPA